MLYILTLLLVLPVALLALSQGLILLGSQTRNNVAEYYGRAIASFTCLILCALYGTLASALLNIAGYGGLGQWTTARAFKWSMWVTTRVWFEIQDEKDWLGTTRPAVLLGNHQTELDVLFLGHVFPRYTSVTSKKSLVYVPFLGWFSTYSPNSATFVEGVENADFCATVALSKTVFIERSSRTQAVAAFDKAAQQMHSARQNVYIFPEGTRSYYDYPDLLPFKKGAFHLAVQAQVPIIPIVVANYSNVLNMKRKVFRSGVIPVRVLEPISTEGKGKEDVDALLEETRSKMLDALKGLHEKVKAEGIAVKVPMGSQGDGPARSTAIDVATT